MFKKISIIIICIVIITSSVLVSAEFGYNIHDEVVVSFNNNTGSVNSSDFWDNLDTPADINTGDITDDGTYVKKTGDIMSGQLTVNSSGEGALIIERDGGGELMSFVRQGVERGQILLNSNDFNIDARTDALVFMIGTTEKMRVHDDGNVNISQNLSVHSLEIRSGLSLFFAGAVFERYNILVGPVNFTGVSVDDNFGVIKNITGSATISTLNNNQGNFSNAITSTANYLLHSLFITKFNDNYEYPELGVLSNDHGKLKILGWEDTNESKAGIELGFYEGQILDVDLEVVGFANETIVMELYNDSVTVLTDLNVSGNYYGNGSQLTGITHTNDTNRNDTDILNVCSVYNETAWVLAQGYSTEGSLWTNSSGNATFTSGNVGIGTSSPTEKLHLANGTFLQTPGNPTLTGFLNDSTNMNVARAVHVSGKYAYVASYSSDSLTIIDISVPSSPILVSSLSNSTYMDGAHAVYVSGKYAYVISHNSNSLVIVDVSNPSSPTLTGFLSNSTNILMNLPQEVYVSGKYAYIVNYVSDSLVIVDISDASSPTIVGNLTDPTNLDGANSVYVSGKYAYVSGSSSDSFAIVDVSNPYSPNLTGVLFDSANLYSPQEVYVSGKYAYVAGRILSSLAIIDISDPSSPNVTGALFDSTNMYTPISVYVSGKYAYVTGSNSNSLAIVDVSNPSSPTLAGSLIDATNMNNPYSVYVSGKYAYVTASSSDSLVVVDIGGIDTSVANIGDLAVSTLDVSENLDVANDLSVRSGIVVGGGGILSYGSVSFDDGNLVTDGKGNVGIGTLKPSSKLEVNGSVNVTGNIIGNQIYGEMWFHNDSLSITTVIGVQNQWYNITGFNSSSLAHMGQSLNGFTFSDSGEHLTALLGGKYRVNYAVSTGNAGNNQEYQFMIAINDVKQHNTDSHRKIGSAGDVGSASGTGFIDLNAGDNVHIMVRNNDGTADIEARASNINLVRIGN